MMIIISNNDNNFYNDNNFGIHTGITGYPLEVLKEIVERSKVRVDVVLTYCKYSVNDTTLLQYKDFFVRKGKLMLCWPLLGMLSKLQAWASSLRSEYHSCDQSVPFAKKILKSSY